MVVIFCFFFKQKTAYEMRISDWSSDVCSSDLPRRGVAIGGHGDVGREAHQRDLRRRFDHPAPAHDRRAVDDGDTVMRPDPSWEIGRASCRESVCRYV